MARTDNLYNFCKDIANSIRTVDGSTASIPASNFAPRILGLTEAGEARNRNRINTVDMPEPGIYRMFYYHEETDTYFISHQTNARFIVAVNATTLASQVIHIPVTWNIAAAERTTPEVHGDWLYIKYPRTASTFRPVIERVHLYNRTADVIPTPQGLSGTAQWVIYNNKMYLTNPQPLASTAFRVIDLETKEVKSFTMPRNVECTGLAVVDTRIFCVCAIGASPNNTMWYFDTETETFTTFVVAGAATAYGNPFYWRGTLFVGTTANATGILTINTDTLATVRRGTTGNLIWTTFVPSNGGDRVTVFGSTASANIPVFNTATPGVVTVTNWNVGTTAGSIPAASIGADGEFIYVKLVSPANETITRLDPSTLQSVAIPVASPGFAAVPTTFERTFSFTDGRIWIGMSSIGATHLANGIPVYDTETGEIVGLPFPFFVNATPVSGWLPAPSSDPYKPVPLMTNLNSRVMFFSSLEPPDDEEVEGVSAIRRLSATPKVDKSFGGVFPMYFNIGGSDGEPEGNEPPQTQQNQPIPIWEENTPHEIGCLRICPIDGNIYRCINPPPVSERARNSRIPPSEAPRFWEFVGSLESEVLDEPE